MNPVVKNIKRFFFSAPIKPHLTIVSEEADTVRMFTAQTMKSVYDATGLKTSRFPLNHELYIRLTKKDPELLRTVRSMATMFNQRIILTYREKEIFIATPK